MRGTRNANEKTCCAKKKERKGEEEREMRRFASAGFGRRDFRRGQREKERQVGSEILLRVTTNALRDARRDHARGISTRMRTADRSIYGIYDTDDGMLSGHLSSFLLRCDDSIENIRFNFEMDLY